MPALFNVTFLHLDRRIIKLRKYSTSMTEVFHDSIS